MSRQARGSAAAGSHAIASARSFGVLATLARIARPLLLLLLSACERTMNVALGMPLFPRSTSRPPVGADVVVEADTALVLMTTRGEGGRREGGLQKSEAA